MPHKSQAGTSWIGDQCQYRKMIKYFLGCCGHRKHGDESSHSRNNKMPLFYFIVWTVLISNQNNWNKITEIDFLCARERGIVRCTLQRAEWIKEETSEAGCDNKIKHVRNLLLIQGSCDASDYAQTESEADMPLVFVSKFLTTILTQLRHILLPKPETGNRLTRYKWCTPWGIHNGVLIYF